MLGVGIGAFVDSFQRSAQLGIKLREDRRQSNQREELKKIGQNSMSGSGSTRERLRNMFQGQANYYIDNGEPEKAAGLMKWIETDDATRGTEYFENAIHFANLASNASDPEQKMALGNEALTWMKKAQKLKGYGGDVDFDFAPVSVDGKFMGWQLTGTDASGNPMKFQLGADNLLDGVLSQGNPKAAALSRIEWDKKKAGERTTDAKALEKEAQSIRSDAIKALEKQYDGGLGGDETKFSDMPTEEREQLINDYAWSTIAPGRRDKFKPYFAGGQTVSPKDAQPAAPGIIVDQNTGQRVSPSQDVTEEPAPGSDGTIVRNDLPVMSGDNSVPAPTAGPGATTPPEEPVRRGNMKTVDAVTSAEDEMRKTGNVQRAAATLKSAGVPERAWPASVRRGLRNQEEPGIIVGPSTRPAINRSGPVGLAQR